MVTAMGATVEEEGLTLSLRPGSLRAVDISVPGDISSAAFWIVAGLCHSDSRVLVRGVGLNPSRTGIIDALHAMGAGDSLLLVDERTEGRRAGGRPVGDPGASCAVPKSAGDMIPRILDEVPILAVAACFAEGVTVIPRCRRAAGQGIRPNRHHRRRAVPPGVPTSRPARTAWSYAEPDASLALTASPTATTGWPWPWQSVDCWPEGETNVHGAADASVSYPSFWEDFDTLVFGRGI